jgi:hypothetical protein
MTPIQIIIGFYLVLTTAIACCVFAVRKSVRIAGGAFALLWSGLMLWLAAEVKEFDYNVWYSSAARALIRNSSDALEAGRTDDVLRVWRKLGDDIEVDYEKRGNFRDIAREAATRLEKPQMPNKP